MGSTVFTETQDPSSTGCFVIMRAAILHGKEDLRVEEVVPIQLQPGEIRVEIEAALTCGTDLKVYKRGYHAKMLRPPSVFGHELAGRIVEVSSNCSGWQIGDRVVPANSAPCGECFFCRHGQANLCDDLLFLNGAYSESVVIPQRIVAKNLLRVKPGTTFADAALTEPFACVVQGATDLDLQGDERVLIIGSGPIGLMFAALCRHLGCEVWLAGRGKERLEAAREIGAATIDVSETPDPLGAQRLKDVYDVVIEAVGKPEAWELAVDLVRKGGRVNFFGGCPSGTKVQLDTARIHYAGLRLLASFHHTPQTIRKALELIEAGVIKRSTFVTREAPLTELPTLFQEMARGNSAVKTLVRVRE